MRIFSYILTLFFFLSCGQKSQTITSIDVIGEYQTYGGLPQRELTSGETEKFEGIVNYDDKHWENRTAEATWSTRLECPTSSNDSTPGDSVATVDSDGTVTAINKGTVMIVATIAQTIGCFELTVSGAPLVAIEVDPVNPSIAAGTTQAFTATGIYEDGTTADITRSVVWSSSNASVASLSNTTGTRGTATGKSPGLVAVTATRGAISGNTLLTVTNAILVSIAVTPTNPTVPLGLTRQFTATGTYSDNSTQDLTHSAAWTSSTLATASINAVGLASTLAVGSTTIGAAFGGKSDSSTLTVSAAELTFLDVTPKNPSIALGLNKSFTATGTYTDGSTQNLTNSVTWSSSNLLVATISNGGGTNGQANSITTGSTTITATSGSLSDSTSLTVTTAALVSISVAPGAPSIAKGLTQAFTATGFYTDGTSQDLTNSALWSSSDISVASVSNAGASKGIATGLGVGIATISATSGLVSGNQDLEVTSAVLQSISVTPAGATIAKTHTRQYTATGTYSDNSTQDITTFVTWISSSNTNATISNAVGSQGLATGVAIGFVRFTAISGAVRGNTTATITP